jgi:hypothetical protein
MYEGTSGLPCEATRFIGCGGDPLTEGARTDLALHRLEAHGALFGVPSLHDRR